MVAGSIYCFTGAVVFILGAMLPWRWLLLVCAAFPLINFICLLFALETPTWYILRGKPDRALEVLNRLRGDKKMAEYEYQVCILTLSLGRIMGLN